MTTTGPATGPAPATLVGGAPAFAGRLLVLERLGLDTYGLADRHTEPGELRSLALLLARQAERLDDADQELRRHAALAIRRLERTRSGDHRDVEQWGLLASLGRDIEALATRYHLAVEHLVMAVHFYRQATESPAAGATASRHAASRIRSSTTVPVAGVEVAAAGPAVASSPARGR
ncbi:hypothetical protein ACFVVU_30755 [Kitasatospora sp. NPDC057965]|uniref:hypothetical protein n=1 Tax=Kitasatospora sp. NPDC057965 TaxID=3346291 RepID=UPI0036DDAD5D